MTEMLGKARPRAMAQPPEPPLQRRIATLQWTFDGRTGLPLGRWVLVEKCRSGVMALQGARALAVFPSNRQTVTIVDHHAPH